MDNIFPKEILNFTAELQVKKHSIKSQIIYISVLLIIGVVLISLPFILVDISVSGQGVIRPIGNNTALYSPANGKLIKVNSYDNKYVLAGETLFEVERTGLNEQIDFAIERKEELELLTEDVQNLLMNFNNSAFDNIYNLKTTFFNQEYLSFKQKVADLNLIYINKKNIYDRQLKLYKENVISQVEFEVAKHDLELSTSGFNMMHQTKLGEWQMMLQNYKNELRSLESELERLQEEKRNLSIKAPITGTVQSPAGLFIGSNVYSNQQLIQISPDSTLIAEVYISPNDIGLLKENMEVKFQVDAFNYQQWGIISGTVEEISDDVNIYKDQPFFKVRCKLSKTYLQLKNGYRGSLTKGMTCKANFIVTERTLWQLLFDKVDNWLNPYSS